MSRGTAVAVAWLPTAASGAAAWLGAGPAAAVGTVLLAGMITALVRREAAQRSARARARAELSAVRLVAAELTAGARPDDALLSAIEAAPHLGAVLGAAADACRADADASTILGRGGLTDVAAAWRVAERSGAPLASVLRRIAGDRAASESRHAAVTAVLAGPRASAALLAVLPVLGLLLGAAMDAHPLHVLARTPAGHLLWCLGAVLDAAGLGWTARIARRCGR
jgi:tight adherence protein B